MRKAAAFTSPFKAASRNLRMINFADWPDMRASVSAAARAAGRRYGDDRREFKAKLLSQASYSTQLRVVS